MAKSLHTRAGHLQASACEAAQCRMWDLPPTFLRPIIFSVVGRCGGSSGLNRASIHSLTCVREVEAALSNGRRACEKDLTHQALLLVTAEEGLLRTLTLGRTRGGGSNARKDRDRSFLMSSFCSRLCVDCKLLRLERSGEQAGGKNGNCGLKYPFFFFFL